MALIFTVHIPDRLTIKKKGDITNGLNDLEVNEV